MKSFFAVAALASIAAAQTVPANAGPTAVVSATGTAPTGCSPDYSGLFQIQVQNATSSTKRKMLRKRQMSGDLIVTLRDSILLSTRNATGYVAGGNHQFQFTTPTQDGQPQSGFIYDAGFTVCGNGSIAHGDTTIFYECAGGDRNIIADINIYGSPQCYPVLLNIYPYSGSGSAAPSSTVTVTGTTGTPGTATVPGGATTATPATVSPDNQPGPGSSGVAKTTSVAIVSQISDNQPQAPTTASAVKTTSPVAIITQISDNQPQAPTGVLTQISDNQPQAPTPAKTPYYSPTGTSGPVQYTGAANALTGGSFAGLAAGAIALALL